MAKVFTSLNSPKLTKMINSGAIGVIPTDTVYGLVGKASKQKAIERLYSIKERKHKAGTTIGASISQLQGLGFPYKPLAHANHYWPASLSVVIDATNVADYLKADRTALPVRIPDTPLLLELLTKTGPLMTTSANAPGQPTATNIKTAMQYFGDSVDFYVDAGELGERPPSTIVGFDHNGQVIIYRQGAVTL